MERKEERISKEKIREQERVKGRCRKKQKGRKRNKNEIKNTSKLETIDYNSISQFQHFASILQLITFLFPIVSCKVINRPDCLTNDHIVVFLMLYIYEL